jgi:hypothetical protein
MGLKKDDQKGVDERGNGVGKGSIRIQKDDIGMIWFRILLKR